MVIIVNVVNKLYIIQSGNRYHKVSSKLIVYLTNLFYHNQNVKISVLFIYSYTLY